MSQVAEYGFVKRNVTATIKKAERCKLWRNINIKALQVALDKCSSSKFVTTRNHVLKALKYKTKVSAHANIAK